MPSSHVTERGRGLCSFCNVQRPPVGCFLGPLQGFSRGRRVEGLSLGVFVPVWPQDDAPIHRPKGGMVIEQRRRNGS